MAKVIAVHEIVRPGEVIKPGTRFTSTGEELEQLKAAGAIKPDTTEAEDAEVKAKKSEDDDGSQTAATKTQTAAKGKGSATKGDNKDLV